MCSLLTIIIMLIVNRGLSPHPNATKILHHKTGAVVWHPLEEATDTGVVQFYEEAEAVLARTPRHGVPMILKPARAKRPAEPYTPALMWEVVRELRDDLKLPSTFTLDACRHRGMTELEEAELTDGQGRALSGHRSKAYEGYAKGTMKRALAATRKRHARKLAANASGTDSQNGTRNECQNDRGSDDAAIA